MRIMAPYAVPCLTRLGAVLTSDRGRKLDDAPRLQSTLLLENSCMEDHGFVYMAKSAHLHDEFLLSHPGPLLHEQDAQGDERDKKDPYIQVRRLRVTRDWRPRSGIAGC